MKKDLLFYIALIFIIAVTIWLVYGIDSGIGTIGTNKTIANAGFQNTGIDLKHFADKITHAPGILILQLIIIILVARVMGYIFQLLGQPMVIGEIVAGLILGPSLLGTLFPEIFARLFPPESVDILQQLSQLGLIFFMFIIGMELDLKSFNKSANKAIIISLASIAIPFLLGIVLAYYLKNEFLHNAHFSSFALFMGTTMSITAFPVLARIVQERKLFHTPVGAMAITVAAIGDVIAWCILAVVVALAKAGSLSNSLLIIGFSVLYILFMLYVIRPLMERIGRVYASREAMGKPIVAFIFLLILISSLLTEAIGIHALFGAFMAGVVMPDNLSFRRVFTEKIEDISMVVLLPLFFVSTGLRTEIGLINSGHLWIVCLIITLTAIVGKFGGTLFASRYVGVNWEHSFVLGVLMNSKGLMELIVLNIGYELGILSPEVFVMLVLMALATTFITGPGLNLIALFHPRKERQWLREKTYKVMLSFANPNMGPTLLKLTRLITSDMACETIFTALHISPRSDLSPADAKIFEKESFAPIRRAAEETGLALNTVYLNSSDIHTEILRTCENEEPDFLILGSARTVFSTDMLGGVVRRIIPEAGCDVLIFNEKNFKHVKKVLLLYFNNGDDYLLSYARLLNHSSEVSFYIYPPKLQAVQPADEKLFAVIPSTTITIEQMQPDFLKSVDLVMVAEKNWKTLEDERDLPVDQFPSLLIIHRANAENRMLKNSTAL